ncbi:MAG: FimV family protein [Ramlibacter sp.]
MKHLLASRCAALAVAGCLAHAAGQAATVGRAQGAVLIGRPLEIAVPLLLEGSGDSAPECAEAEVFYGDTKVPASNVNTEFQTAARGPVVRVRSGAAVNEPVVTVYLQLGCGSRFTRRLVLLAEPDPAVDVQRPAPGVIAAPKRAEAVEAAVNAAQLNLSTSRGLPATAQAAAVAPQPVPRKRLPPSPPASRPAAAVKPAAAKRPKALATAPVLVQPAPPARDQLKLDVPAGVAEPAPPSEEQLRQAARLQSIERDLGEMRQFLKRNDSAMLQLQAQLARAESQRYSNPLVYALSVLLLIMAALMAYFWRRAVLAREAAEDDWWRSPRAEREAGRPAAASTGARDPERQERPEKASAPVAFGVADAVPAGMAASDPVTPTVRVPLTSVTARTDDFQSSQAGSRALKAEELHDVQQEADFFSSLGEYDRAIEVLRGHIQAHPETSAVAWLDLVEIYHKLGRREEFDWVRREFRQRFNAQVPAFDDYSQESAGIEAYDHAMARIAALWPSRRVLDVIEESIFRGPSKDGAEAFSLQAYRELLLLHHIGQQVLVGSDSPRTHFSDSGPVSGSNPDSHGFSHTSIHPLSTGLSSLDLPPREAPRGQHRREDLGDLELDLNLDEPQVQARHQADPHLLDFDLPDIGENTQTSSIRR